VEVPGLDGRVLVFRCGSDIVDTFAVRCREFDLLIDTMISPGTADQAVQLLERSESSPPLLVLNTHGDHDHAWGNCLFAGATATRRAPVIGHADVRRRLAEPSATRFLSEQRAKQPGWYGDITLVAPTIEFREEFMLRGGDLTLLVFLTPGHTPDHVSVWIEELGVLIAGDAAEFPVPLIHSGDDVPIFRASLRRMRDLNAKVVLYCHSSGITAPDVIEANLGYFDELEARIDSTLRSGKAPDSVTPQSLDWPFEAAIPLGRSIGDVGDPDFYRRSHAMAIDAMARHLAAR
jgi:glyoxylase-like metal-dependent hydrolase (beta-lactamase superfamily II)